MEELTPEQIIETAINEYGVTEFWVGCSGGKDSISLSHWMYNNFPELMKGNVFANTGIAVPDVKPFLQRYCEIKGWTLKVVNAIKEFDQMVKERGFPHVRAHVIVMRILKMIPVRRFILNDEMPKGSNKQVCVLLGVRQNESKRRMKILKTPFYKDGRMLYVSPFLYKSNEWIYQYYLDHKLERSPAYDTLHISGDCLCGCFADKDEMKMIEIFYPEVAKRIHGLEDEIKDDPNIPEEFKKWGSNSYQQSKKKKKQSKKEIITCSDCFFDAGDKNG